MSAVLEEQPVAPCRLDTASEGAPEGAVSWILVPHNWRAGDVALAADVYALLHELLVQYDPQVGYCKLLCRRKPANNQTLQTLH